MRSVNFVHENLLATKRIMDEHEQSDNNSSETDWVEAAGHTAQWLPSSFNVQVTDPSQPSVHSHYVLPSTSSMMQSFPAAGASTIILNINGVRQEIPINFNLENNMAELLAMSPGSVVTTTGHSSHFTNTNASSDDRGLSSLRPSSPANVVSATAVTPSYGRGEFSYKDMPKAYEEPPHQYTCQLFPKEDSDEEFQPVNMVKKKEISQNTEDVANSVTTQRKSNRLALKSQSYHKKLGPIYQPVPYNPEELWCDDCQEAFLEGCPQHHLSMVADKEILSRAQASLPSCLVLSTQRAGGSRSVTARKLLPKRTTFGPLHGELVDNPSLLPPHHCQLPVEVSGQRYYHKLDNEEACNWLMFVPMAINIQQQNMVVYQHKKKLYFTCCRNIQPKEELQFWYAANYAHAYGLELLPDINTAFLHLCSECPATFKTLALLQQHVAVHDQDELVQAAAVGDSTDSSDTDHALDLVMKKDSTALKPQVEKYFRQSFYRRKIRHTIKQHAALRKQKVTVAAWFCQQCCLNFETEAVHNIHKLKHVTERPSMTAEAIRLSCPSCPFTGEDQSALITHVDVHSIVVPATVEDDGTDKPYRCGKCVRCFRTWDQLLVHLPRHFQQAEKERPLACQDCPRRFLTNSALACHRKIHNKQGGFFSCLVCALMGHTLNFRYKVDLRRHSEQHRSTNGFACPSCHCVVPQFSELRVHIRSHHPYQRLPCPHCNKVFSRADKLKVHQLVHSDRREFMCDQCGRQFKRKDKLKDHVRRMHVLTNQVQNRKISNTASPSRWQPKVAATEYERFIYRCQDCQLGFKRRGMLVNHLAKCHPGKLPSSVAELNLPILRTKKEYFCQYCNKVYRSSSKRKHHVLVKHPGAALPPSIRSTKGEKPDDHIIMCQAVGNVTSTPHSCQLCHKQYASRPKLLQHLRSQHPKQAPPLKPRNKPTAVSEQNTAMHALPVLLSDNPPAQQQPQYNDILSQAMSELTQSYSTATTLTLQLPDGRMVQPSFTDLSELMNGDMPQLLFQCVSAESGQDDAGTPVSLVTIGRNPFLQF